jgi:hypothetical protein
MKGGDQEHIPGGFILLSRKLLKSGIMGESALHLKLWVWMLLEASHKEHGNLKRGQFFTSLPRIQKAMSRKIGWRTEKFTENAIREVMKFLMKTAMIHRMKVLHGSVITILNYDYYQTVENYEFAYDSQNEPQNEPQNNNKNGYNNNKYSCPYNQILDLYHKILAELPRVRKFTEHRRKMLLARWNEKAKSERGLYSNTLEFWEAFFKYISQSDFLMGRKTDFRANFEWIVTKRNFNKIIEGVYHRG